jgi:hypothetical protein
MMAVWHVISVMTLSQHPAADKRLGTGGLSRVTSLKHTLPTPDSCSRLHRLWPRGAVNATQLC